MFAVATPSQQVSTTKEAPLSFTLETQEKTVEFFQPIAIRVVVRNNSQSSISFDPKTLRLHSDNWHVVGTWGQWSGRGEGGRLDTEDKSSGRVELAPGASKGLLFVHKYPTFELLGPTRVGYKLSSTNANTQKLLPVDIRELSLQIPPTKLMTSVWAASSQTEREQSQVAFNEFLRFWAKTETQSTEEKEAEADFQQRLSDDEFATKTLFYLAGYALPFLSDATRDRDPFIRAQAVLAYPYATGGIDQLDAYLDALDALGPRPQWALSLNKGHNKEQADWRAFALRALSDPAPSVRMAGIAVLTKKDWSESKHRFITTDIGFPKRNSEAQANQPTPATAKSEQAAREFEAVKTLAKDSDAGVRAAVQEYLKSFIGQRTGADIVAEALSDQDPTVRNNAIEALLRSPEPPSLQTLNEAFALAKGDTAQSLIQLFLEQENSSLAAVLGKNFVERSEAERLIIMTAIAGHNDAGAIDLIKSGLNDPATAVQRAAVMRLLALPANISLPLIDTYLRRAPSELKSAGEALRREIETRRLWPFLKETSGDQAGAEESIFPSQNGRTPMRSPDGRWIAYVETGWGRPGGTGGFGRSNLISITHVVGSDGKHDQVVSDMFLVSWMSDSERIGTARDAFVAISDLAGNVMTEFGESLEERYRGNYAGVSWTTNDLRSQFGGSMPHQKRLVGSEDFGFGEGGAFSPDGKWYGPLQDAKGFFFLAADGRRLAIKLPIDERSTNARWSPDGRYVQIAVDRDWLIVDMQTLRFHKIQNAGDGNSHESNSGWSPWSKDGTRLTFVRDGQVWVSDAFGNGAKQLTYDATAKALPTLSPDGRSVAYRTWLINNRRHYPRIGRTDLWVVDIATTLVTRLTKPANGKIISCDWIDDQTLICDRLEDGGDTPSFSVPRSSLRRISLNVAANN